MAPLNIDAYWYNRHVVAQIQFFNIIFILTSYHQVNKKVFFSLKKIVKIRTYVKTMKNFICD